MDYQLLASLCEMETRYDSDMNHIYSVEEDDIILNREAPEKDILESKFEEFDAILDKVSPNMANALIAVETDDSDVYDLYEMSASPEELREYFAIKPLAQEVYLLRYAYDLAEEYDYLPLGQVEETDDFNYLYFSCIECNCEYILEVFRKRHAMQRERHLKAMDAYLKGLSC